MTPVRLPVPVALVQLLLLFIVAGGREPEGLSVTVTAVSPVRFPLSGGQPLVVTGTGFGAEGGTAWCNFESIGAVGPLSHSIPRSGYKGPSIDVVPARVKSETELTCNSPTVIVPGRAALTVTLGNVSGPSSPEPCIYGKLCPPDVPGVVEYFSLVDVVIGRRPYIAEGQGSLLVTTDPSLRGKELLVSAVMPGGGPGLEWHWQLKPQNGTSVLWFSLSALSDTVNADLKIVVYGEALPQKTNITILRRLLRAPQSGAPDVGVSVIDHTTRQILIDGRGFQGVGWYVNGGGSVSSQLATISTQVRLGVNQIMPYAMVDMNATEQRTYMDACHAMGVKVLYPMQMYGQSGTGHARNWSSGYFQHFNGSAAAAAWQAQVLATVETWKTHPALLGWYICDDCTVVNANIKEVSMEARLYNLIRSRDMYHITAGAIQGGSPWMHSDVPNAIAPSASQPRCSHIAHSGAAMDWAGCNPDTQLSIDYSLMENYNRLLINLDSPLQQNRDVRRGMEQAVIANCNGLWVDGNFLDDPAVPNDLASAMWLGPSRKPRPGLCKLPLLTPWGHVQMKLSRL